MTAGATYLRLIGRTETNESGCWEWMGYRDRGGYGRVNDKGSRSGLVHVLMYEALCGFVPDGLELDHLCRNTSCCNPLHLEPVTHAENMRRGAQANKPYCVRGHARTADNLYVNPNSGLRHCRACHREDVRQAKERKRNKQEGA